MNDFIFIAVVLTVVGVATSTRDDNRYLSNHHHDVSLG